MGLEDENVSPCDKQIGVDLQLPSGYEDTVKPFPSLAIKQYKNEAQTHPTKGKSKRLPRLEQDSKFNLHKDASSLGKRRTCSLLFSLKLLEVNMVMMKRGAPVRLALLRMPETSMNWLLRTSGLCVRESFSIAVSEEVIPSL